MLVLAADSEAEALRILADLPVAVLCLGAGFPGESALAILDQADGLRGADERINLVLAGGSDLSRFQDWIDRDRLFYLTPEPIPAADLVPLLRSGVERRRGVAEAPAASEEAQAASRIAAAVAAVAGARTPAEAGWTLASAAADLVAAERAWCLLHDPESDTLWEGEPGAPDERRESAAVGLVSFVARTGAPVVLERVGRDPRFDRDADDPQGSADDRFAAVPVTAPGSPRVLAVLAAVRPPGRPPFAERDVELLQRLAEQTGPGLARQVEARLSLTVVSPLFREEALAFHQEGLRVEGDLLRADPRWMQWTYRLLVLVLAAGLLFSLLGRVREFASGPAVVRLGGRTDLRATAAGTVAEVEVARGDQVAPGRLLVRLYDAQEAAALERIEREIELQLIDRLRNPADLAAERSLISLRAERELAQARLAEREVRAPAAGVVSDLRIRPGQLVQPGQVLVSLVGEGGEPRVLALLPGEHRPLLKPGMPLRLELQGYPYLYQQLTVEEVGDEVVGPGEAKRYLGEDIADAVPLQGPVVLVTARLPSLTFEFEERQRRYHDGMWAQAEVRVRSERILVALVPALRALFEKPEAGGA